MKHKIEIAPNLAIYIDGERVIGSKPHGLFLTTEMIVSDEDLKRLSDRCLEVIADTPQTETQTKTQNSNLTFKTLEYCDICDHKGCEECIANALDEHCIPSQFKKQIEDECAKEYEELGLKELKELIDADRKDEPQNYCDDCLYTDTCDSKEFFYACTSKATISKMEQVEDEPQTEMPELNNIGEAFKDFCDKTDIGWK